MKKQNLLKKTKSAAKFMISMVVCLSLVMAVVPVSASAADKKASYQGYKWTRMDSKEEFEAYRNKAMVTSDGDLTTGK